MHIGMLVAALAIVGRSAQVQLFETGQWRRRAQAQHVASSTLPAPRGTILDEGGTVLVETRQLVKLSVAPREVAADQRKRGDGASRLAALARALAPELARAKVAPEWAAKATDTSRAWVVIPGRFLASDVTAITAMRGVHAEPALERVAPANAGLRALIGHADDAGGALDGLEHSLDSLLQGERGSEALLRDARGARYEPPGGSGVEASPGHTVLLTINQSLQDIAERALEDAVKGTRAVGGDIVVLDPRNGEVRALASRRDGEPSPSVTALTEPYEPGSTIKPIFAARVLDLGRAKATDVVETYGGKWNLNGRMIVDDHPGARYSLADVIRFSSNIGIIQFVQRLSPAEEYETLRDAGFGVPTGFPYPVEESGRLPHPKRWDGMTQASMAMGYALNVTPLQLATAYAAIANGGELLEPGIVKEIRAPTGEVRYTHQRRVVRRIMTPAAARTVREMMRGVVESGTAGGTNLSTFDVAGKTGTAKRIEHGKYVQGKYTASFVGIFPVNDPQLVVLVKLDDPKTEKYGGKAAAPVSQQILRAAIAAREASLDRKDLAAAPARAVRSTPVPDSVLRADAAAHASDASSVPFVYRVDSARGEAKPVLFTHPVPDVRGMPIRGAVRSLHRAGFRVSLAATSSEGSVTATVPEAGAVAPEGATVRLMRAP